MCSKWSFHFGTVLNVSAHTCNGAHVGPFPPLYKRKETVIGYFASKNSQNVEINTLSLKGVNNPEKTATLFRSLALLV